MRALALDVGSKTIGLAVSDAAGVIAMTVGVLERKGNALDAVEVLARARTLGADVIVVGMPLELDGRIGRRARRVEQLVEALSRQLAADELSLTITTWDERFSTAAAERTLLEADVSRAKRRVHVDALAAQHILQGWLDARIAREERELS